MIYIYIYTHDPAGRSAGRAPGAAAAPVGLCFILLLCCYLYFLSCPDDLVVSIYVCDVSCLQYLLSVFL